MMAGLVYILFVIGNLFVQGLISAVIYKLLEDGQQSVVNK
jgi:hypothetical protein